MRRRSNAHRSKKDKHKHTYHYSVITIVRKSAEVRQTLSSTSRLTASTKAVYSLSKFGLTKDHKTTVENFESLGEGLHSGYSGSCLTCDMLWSLALILKFLVPVLLHHHCPCNTLTIRFARYCGVFLLDSGML